MARKKRKSLPPVLDTAAFGLLQGGFAVMGIASLPTGRRVGAFIGRIAWALMRRHRAITLDNLDHAWPELSPVERRRLGRRIFENLGMILFEMAWSLRRAPGQLNPFFRIKGRHHADHAFAQGKGILALTGHFGNWELLSVTGGQLGYLLTVVYRPLDFPPLERFILAFRSRFGAAFISKKSRSFRKILGALADSHMISLLMDQKVAIHEGVFTDFFHRPACTNKGMALLALKTGAPVVPVFLVRDPDGFTAHFLPPVPLIDTGDKIRDIEENTRNYTAVIEEMVRRHPEQWFWVHRRWTTPTASPWPRT